MQSPLKLLTLTHHIELTLSIPPITAVAEVGAAYDWHGYFVCGALVVGPGAFGVEGPPLLSIFEHFEVGVVVGEEFFFIDSVDTRDVFFDHASSVEAISFWRGR